MSAMKGLIQFITNVRQSKSNNEEQEKIAFELSHITEQFNNNQLSSYHKRKYICKLLYVYLLGYENLGKFNFEKQCLELVKDDSYQDKEIGYLAFQLIYTKFNNSNNLKNDLQSSNSNIVELAIVSICNLISTGNLELTELYDDLIILLKKNELSNIIKSKIVTTLSIMIKNKGIKNEKDFELFVLLFKKSNGGLLLSLCNLFDTIAYLNYKLISNISNDLIKKLNEIVELKGELFHGVKEPWITIKLIELLKLISNSKDFKNDENVQHIIEILMTTCISIGVKHDISKETMLINGSILIEIIELYQDKNIVCESLIILSKTKLDVNLKLKFLDAFITLHDCDSLAQNINLWKSYLKDVDLGVRNRTIQLLILICNEENVKEIVSTLVDHLNYCDLRNRMALINNINELISKFSNKDLHWNFETVIKVLIKFGGSTVGNGNGSSNLNDDKIFENLSIILINNENIRGNAIKLILNGLKSGSSENFIRFSCFVLGEFKTYHNIVKTFEILVLKYGNVSILTRLLMLNCFVKFYFDNIQIREIVIKLFDQESRCINIEIQQRALEYLSIMKKYDDNELNKIDQIFNNLQINTADGQFKLKDDGIKEHDLILSNNWKEGYYRFMRFDQGIFYEDSVIKIIYRLKRDKNKIKLDLSFVSKIDGSKGINNFKSVLNNLSITDDNYDIKILENPLESFNKRTKQVFEILMKSPFNSDRDPILSLSMNEDLKINLKLDLLLKSLSSGGKMSKSMFSTRWNQIQEVFGNDGESIIENELLKSASKEMIERCIKSIGFEILEDSNSNNGGRGNDEILCCGILNYTSGNIGCLVRINLQEDVKNTIENVTEYRKAHVTLRCSRCGVSAILVDLLGELIAQL